MKSTFLHNTDGTVYYAYAWVHVHTYTHVRKCTGDCCKPTKSLLFDFFLIVIGSFQKLEVSEEDRPLPHSFANI